MDSAPGLSDDRWLQPGGRLRAIPHRNDRRAMTGRVITGLDGPT
jgi:hypothetical protein